MEEQRGALSEPVADASGQAAATHLIAEPIFEQANRLALYAAAGREMPTDALAAAARAAGKLVFWPRVVGDALEFARCEAPDLVRGGLGVLEPPADRPAEPLEGTDLVVVPGLAFDATGMRLGRGGGHFDRTFPPGAAGAPVLVGLAYTFQVCDRVPWEPHDRRVDWLVTESGVLRSAAPGVPR